MENNPNEAPAEVPKTSESEATPTTNPEPPKAGRGYRCNADPAGNQSPNPQARR